MSFTDVVDAWMGELTSSVPGLADVTPHRYASWSVEALQASKGERHLAIWPEVEAEVTEGLTTDGSLLATQGFVVTVWEDASVESTRRFDDEVANAAWLALAEAIRARFMVRANLRLGDPLIMRTQYLGTTFDLVGMMRVMTLRLAVRVPLQAA